MKNCLFNIICFLTFAYSGYSQLVADAGGYKVICPNGTVTIGGIPTASNGNPPYTYKWEPSSFLNSATIANPVASNLTSDMWYKVTVMDKDSNFATSFTNVRFDIIETFNAGVDTGYCMGQEGGPQLGASNNNNALHQFSWLPTSGLSDPTAPNPVASPTVSTTYTLTVTDVFCPTKKSTVTVTPFDPPYTFVGNDTIINEGSVITLHGIGGVKYYWLPDYNIKYSNTTQPDVFPLTATTYTLQTLDQHGCYNQDEILVGVKETDQLFFYSAFTPNHDGENDAFYIGNLGKYPDNNLKIYNRYGKLIYSATNYDNTWDGTYLGTEVPTGTYFYIFDDGKDQKYKGTVTIMR